MVKEIVKDVDILSQKSEPFVFGEDDDIITDMVDTAESLKDKCVGLAAVQIGTHKKVIVVSNGSAFIPMINPRIIKHSNVYYTSQEACLSLDGIREVKRYRDVTVMYQDVKGKFRRESYTGFTAKIIQHECDHLDGKLI